MLSCVLETDIMYPKSVSQLLEHTLPALNAGSTVTAMCCKKQLHYQFPVFLNLS